MISNINCQLLLMMNRLFILIILFLIISCDAKHEGFTIKGKIDGVDNGTALLRRRFENKFITIDSAEINDGIFKLSGLISEPQMCYIWISDSLPPIRLILENVDYSIKAGINDLNNPIIKGSSLQDKLGQYNALIRPYEDKLDSIYYLIQMNNTTGNQESLDSLSNVFNEVELKERSVEKEFVINNGDNIIGPYILWGTLAYDLELNEIRRLTSKFSPELDTTIYVKQIKNHIETLQRVSLGNRYVEISLPDTSGQETKLSDYLGNYVLIDFWASWCGPCRRENPRVVAIYNEYKEKGFEIFGVSLDTDADAWQEAIHKDGLNWIHVSDLLGWNSKAVKLYGIRAIPHTVLIDKEGLIIAKNLRGKGLKEALQKLFINQ